MVLLKILNHCSHHFCWVRLPLLLLYMPRFSQSSWCSHLKALSALQSAGSNFQHAGLLSSSGFRTAQGWLGLSKLPWQPVISNGILKCGAYWSSMGGRGRRKQAAKAGLYSFITLPASQSIFLISWRWPLVNPIRNCKINYIGERKKNTNFPAGFPGDALKAKPPRCY